VPKCAAAVCFRRILIKLTWADTARVPRRPDMIISAVYLKFPEYHWAAHPTITRHWHARNARGIAPGSRSGPIYLNHRPLGYEPNGTTLSCCDSVRVSYRKPPKIALRVRVLVPSWWQFFGPAGQLPQRLPAPNRMRLTRQDKIPPGASAISACKPKCSLHRLSC
jgi:hypothetical protein